MYNPTLQPSNPPTKAIDLANTLSAVNPSGTFFWLFIGESRSGLSYDFAILYVDSQGAIKSASQLSHSTDSNYTLAKLLGGRLKLTTPSQPIPLCVLSSDPKVTRAAKRMLTQLGEWIGDQDTFANRQVT